MFMMLAYCIVVDVAVRECHCAAAFDVDSTALYRTVPCKIRAEKRIRAAHAVGTQPVASKVVCSAGRARAEGAIVV